MVRKFGTGVFYYPSFQIILCLNPLSFRYDNRHVNSHVVDDIFSPMLTRS